MSLVVSLFAELMWLLEVERCKNGLLDVVSGIKLFYRKWLGCL